MAETVERVIALRRAVRVLVSKLDTTVKLFWPDGQERPQFTQQNKTRVNCWQITAEDYKRRLDELDERFFAVAGELSDEEIDLEVSRSNDYTETLSRIRGSLISYKRRSTLAATMPSGGLDVSARWAEARASLPKRLSESDGPGGQESSSALDPSINRQVAFQESNATGGAALPVAKLRSSTVVESSSIHPVTPSESSSTKGNEVVAARLVVHHVTKDVEFLKKPSTQYPAFQPGQGYDELPESRVFVATCEPPLIDPAGCSSLRKLTRVVATVAQAGRWFYRQEVSGRLTAEELAWAKQHPLHEARQPCLGEDVASTSRGEPSEDAGLAEFNSRLKHLQTEMVMNVSQGGEMKIWAVIGAARFKGDGAPSIWWS